MKSRYSTHEHGRTRTVAVSASPTRDARAVPELGKSRSGDRGPINREALRYRAAEDERGRDLGRHDYAREKGPQRSPGGVPAQTAPRRLARRVVQSKAVRDHSGGEPDMARGTVGIPALVGSS